MKISIPNRMDFLSHCLYESSELEREVENFIKTSEYVYSNTFINYVDRFNRLIDKYSANIGIQMDNFILYEHEFSETKKTIRNPGVERFKIFLRSIRDSLQEEISREKQADEMKIIPSHQMRKCLKIGTEGCPKNPLMDSKKVFVGMPFDDKYQDSYSYGIKIALESVGLNPYRADNEIENKDIMCKICNEMQISKYLIFNISGLNPNVMLELGLSYGLGKETIIVKDKETKAVSDIASIEYIEYGHAYDLQTKLRSFFESK